MASLSPHHRDKLFPGSAEMAGRMRDVDWSRTPVGPIETWPHSVRAIIRMMLTTRYAMWMGWGHELTFFYNDAYAQMTLGAKHPWALGRPASEVWAEIWPDIGPRIEHVLATGEATWDEGLLLFLERSGFPEETYHTFSYSPLHDDAGDVGGMFCVVTEETTRVIGERRLGLLREFGTRLAASQTTHDVWAAVEQSMTTDARDLPFTLAYLIGEDETTATLVASSNVAAGDPIASESLRFDDPLWPIRTVVEGAARSPLLVDLDATIAWPCGPWRKPPARAMVLPIPQQAQTRPAGVFIAGLNPYRPVDAEYESFITLYVGQLAAGLANAQAYASERRRAEALAEIDRAKTTFFSNVSHEFRTPLTLMLGARRRSAQIARRGAVPSGAAGAGASQCAAAAEAREHAARFFPNRGGARRSAFHEPTDLAELTASLAAAFRSATDRAGLTLVVDCQPLGELVYVDRDMWEKVVLNLVSNAFKFTLEGQIRVGLQRVDGAAVLTVQDTGSGIPPDELPLVFERFHRVAETRGRTHEGTGIGLALVHELVKLHGGTVDVEQRARPRQHVHRDRPARHRAPSRRHARSTRRHVERPGARCVRRRGAAVAARIRDRRRRLGSRDRRGPRRAIRAVAHAGPPRAHPARGRQRRHARIRPSAPRAGAGTSRSRRTAARPCAPPSSGRRTLVITDVMMPELDGFELLRQLREHAATCEVPVMMLSARAGEESRVEGLAGRRGRLPGQTVLGARARGARRNAAAPRACPRASSRREHAPAAATSSRRRPRRLPSCAVPTTCSRWRIRWYPRSGGRPRRGWASP